MADAGASISRGFAVDTTFVLFFLAMDFGQSFSGLALDSVFSLLTLGVLLIAPYFLPSNEAKPAIASWVAGRTVIALFAILLGIALRQTVGTVLPEAFRFLPMTMLIATAMVSCYVQFYGFMRLRWAK